MTVASGSDVASNHLPTFWPQPAAAGAPLGAAALKTTPEDFVVDEYVSWEPDGSGEHDLLWIEKRGANTRWVVDQLATFAGCPPRDVGYAGLKDRNAVTRQWFSIYRPGRSIDWSSFSAEGVRIVTQTAHQRKLRVGALAGNAFMITLRNVDVDASALRSRIDALSMRGMPNYFGAQRFGREHSNIQLAHRLASRQRLKRAQKGFALSAARAAIFNAVLAKRVGDGTWCTPIAGDVMMLAGSNSFFAFDGLTDVDDIIARCARADLSPAGPLWGKAGAVTDGAAHTLESDVADHYEVLKDATLAGGATLQRRTMRVLPEQLSAEYDGTTLQLRFRLPAGCFATVLIHELLDAQDLSQRSRT